MIHLAWTNLRYRLLRTTVAVLSITVGIWLAMMLRGVSQGTLQRSLDEMRSLDRFMMVRAPGPIFRLSQNLMPYDADQLRKLSEVDGIEAAIPFRFFLQQLTPERLGMVAALPVESFHDAVELFPIVKGSPPSSAGEALVDKDLADVLGIRIGQTLTLTGLGKFKVSGLMSSRTQLTTVQLLLDYETVARGLNDTRIQGVFVKVSDPALMERVKNTVHTSFPNLVAEPLQIVADSLGKALNRFDQFIQLIFWLSITVAALICGLVLLSMVGEQRRDLGILKAMGASDLAVMALIVSQALFLGLSGATFGAAGAWLVKSAFLPRFFPALHMDLTLQWFLEAIAAGVGSGMLGAIVATAYALRVDPVEVLTYE